MAATASRQPACTAAEHPVDDDARPVLSQDRHSPRPRPAPPQPLSPFDSHASSSSARPVSHAPSSFQPGQTPLHRGCAGWVSPVEAIV